GSLRSASPGGAWAPAVPRAGPRRSHRAWRRHRPRQPRRHADGCGRGERLGIAGRYHGRSHRAALMMRRVLLALSTRPAIGRWMERVPATRALVRRFVAATTTEDAPTGLG